MQTSFFKPTTHNVFSHLESASILKTLITMNIDKLYQKLYSKNIVEYQGNMRLNRCCGCNKKYDWDVSSYIIKTK